MGLFWSLIQEPGQKPGRRFITYDARKPMTNKLYVLLGMLEAKQCLEYIAGDQVLARKTIERIYMADGVQRTEVRQGRLVATLFMPAGWYTDLWTDRPASGPNDRPVDRTINQTVDRLIGLWTDRSTELWTN